MTTKQNELQVQYELLSEKIRRLRQEFVIETEVVSRFKLEQELNKTENERTEIERELARVEQLLQRNNQEKFNILTPLQMQYLLGRDTKGILKILANHAGEVDEIINFLKDLQNVYENLYAFELKIFGLQIEKFTVQNPPIKLSPIQEIHKLLLPNDKLILHKVHIESPGFWEILGSLNPLIQIREYLKERHERKKDKKYREDQEHRKMVLENMNFETDILSKQIDLLKKANIPEEDIRRFVICHYYKPLIKLHSYQDTGMIESAEVISILPEPPEPISNGLSGSEQLELPSSESQGINT